MIILILPTSKEQKPSVRNVCTVYSWNTQNHPSSRRDLMRSDRCQKKSASSVTARIFFAINSATGPHSKLLATEGRKRKERSNKWRMGNWKWSFGKNGKKWSKAPAKPSLFPFPSPIPSTLRFKVVLLDLRIYPTVRSCLHIRHSESHNGERHALHEFGLAYLTVNLHCLISKLQKLWVMKVCRSKFGRDKGRWTLPVLAKLYI